MTSIPQSWQMLLIHRADRETVCKSGQDDLELSPLGIFDGPAPLAAGV